MGWAPLVVLGLALRRGLGQVRLHGLPWLVLALGLLVTAVVVEQQRRFNLARAERIDRNLAEDVRAAIEARMATVTAVLSAAEGLFLASDAVSRQEFRRFYTALKLSNSALMGLQGLGYSMVVPAGGRASLEERLHSEGLRDFKVHPPTTAELTTTILYLEPPDWRNERAMGFDMYSNPTRREAMRRAAITGDTTLTPPVKLVQETESDAQVGALVYRALYNGQPVTGRDRLQELKGWVFVPLRMTDLLRSTLGTIGNPELQGTGVVIYDGSRPTREALLFDSQDLHGRPDRQRAHWSSARSFNRDWLIGIVRPADRMEPLGIGSTVVLSGLLGLVGSVAAALATQRLVADHLALKKALVQAEQASGERALAATVLDTSPVGIVVTDPNGFVITTNPAFTQISGYSRVEAQGRKCNLMKSGRHDEGFYRDLWDSIVQRGHWHGELWNRHRNGEIRRHDLSITAVFDGLQQITHFVGMLQDVTERYEEQETIRHQALHDYLTDLPNRSLLMQQLAQSLALARRYGHQVGLLFMDLNGFKRVNDSHGHSTGDELLRQVARRLKQNLRESDVLSRQGGDEFVLLIPNAPELAQLMHLAETLRNAVEEPYPELPASVAVSLSIGIAHWPDHGHDADSLLNAADRAMYRAKHGAPGHIAVAECAPGTQPLHAPPAPEEATATASKEPPAALETPA